MAPAAGPDEQASCSYGAFVRWLCQQWAAPGPKRIVSWRSWFAIGLWSGRPREGCGLGSGPGAAVGGELAEFVDGAQSPVAAGGCRGRWRRKIGRAAVGEEDRARRSGRAGWRGGDDVATGRASGWGSRACAGRSVAARGGLGLSHNVGQTWDDAVAWRGDHRLRRSVAGGTSLRRTMRSTSLVMAAVGRSRACRSWVQGRHRASPDARGCR